MIRQTPCDVQCRSTDLKVHSHKHSVICALIQLTVVLLYAMPRGRRLQDFLRGQIIAYGDAGLCGAAIGRRLNVPKSTVNDILAGRSGRIQKVRRGRKSTLSKHDVRCVQNYYIAETQNLY